MLFTVFVLFLLSSISGIFIIHFIAGLLDETGFENCFLGHTAGSCSDLSFSDGVVDLEYDLQVAGTVVIGNHHPVIDCSVAAVSSGMEGNYIRISPRTR